MIAVQTLIIFKISFFYFDIFIITNLIFLGYILTSIHIFIISRHKNFIVLLLSFFYIFQGILKFHKTFLYDFNYYNHIFYSFNSRLDLIIAVLLIYFVYNEKEYSIKSNSLLNQTIMNSIKTPVIVIDKNNIIEINKEAYRLLCTSKRQILGKSILDYSVPIQKDGMESSIALKNIFTETSTKSFFKAEWLFLKKDNSIFPAEVHFNKSTDNSNDKFILLLFDLTEKNRINRLNKLTNFIFNNALEGFFILNNEPQFIFVNKTFENITGYTTDEITGKHLSDINDLHFDISTYLHIYNKIINQGSLNENIWFKKKNNEDIYLNVNIFPSRDENNNIENFLGRIIDITSNYRKDEQISNIINFDPLTSFFTKSKFIKLINDVMLSNDVAVYNIDINNFNLINDNYGYLSGDELLQKFSERLEKIISDKDFLCRVSGDEFLLCSVNESSEEEILRNIENIFSLTAEPFFVSDEIIYIRLSIGIITNISNQYDSSFLIEKANTALNIAKKKGNNSFELFNETMSNAINFRLKIENQLRRAIIDDKITPFFQPKIDITENRIIGMEALARWITDKNEIVPPMSFVPVAEKTDLIYPLSEKIMNISCIYTNKWNLKNNTSLKVALNLSARHFKNYDIKKTITDLIRRTGISREHLELEITESAFLKQEDEVFAIFKYFKNMGITIALDDFGTGYSSFSYLKKLPIDSLKIDKSFIDDISEDEKSRKIVHSIITIANNLNLDTVAEGVETENQVNILKNLGCNIIQGYVFSKPLSVGEFENYLKKSLTGNIF